MSSAIRSKAAGKEAGRRRVLASLLLPGLLTFVSGCRAQQPWPLWDAYTARFLDAQGRVIDRSAGDRTTSEGQAYAMFFALVDNDRPHFDKLLAWTEANLAQGDLTARLPAWSWGHSPSGEWKVLDDNPASDADLWLAYVLLQAARLWHDPRYDRLGRQLAARVAREEVVLVEGVGTTLIPGPHGFHPDTASWYLNPSYLPLPVLTYMERHLPEGPWGSMVESLPAVLSGQPGQGFAMDWLLAEHGGIHACASPAEPSSGSREAHSAGSYDAIRVYLWLGLADGGTPLRRDLVAGLPGLAAAAHAGAAVPLEVSAEGKVVRGEAPPGFSAAAALYLEAAGLQAEARRELDRTQAARDPATGLYGRTAEYYDQNLVLFSTGFLERRYRFERDGKLQVRWK